MAASFKIDTLDHIVRVTFEHQTVITPELVIDAMQRENQAHKIEGRYDLWDFRGCPPSDGFGYDAVTRIIEYIDIHHSKIMSEKTALLVEETLQFGLSRMFQILIDEFPTRIGIFQEEADAIAWLTAGESGGEI